MNVLIMLVLFASVILVFMALLKARSLNKKIPGGIVKGVWQLLYYLIGLMAAGYLTFPLFPQLPESSRDLVIAIIVLANAVFILLVIKLIQKIVREVGL
jgi:hypothetical protein